MPLQEIEREIPQTGGQSLVSVPPLGRHVRIDFNAALGRNLFSRGVFAVTILFDAETGEFVLTPVPKDDPQALQLIRPRRASPYFFSAVNSSGRSFLLRVGWQAKKRVLIPLQWSGKVYTGVLPAKYIGGSQAAE